MGFQFLGFYWKWVVPISRPAAFYKGDPNSEDYPRVPKYLETLKP